MSRRRGVQHGGSGHDADMAMALERQTLWPPVCSDWTIPPPVATSTPLEARFVLAF